MERGNKRIKTEETNDTCRIEHEHEHLILDDTTRRSGDLDDGTSNTIDMKEFSRSSELIALHNYNENYSSYVTL